MLVLKRRQGEKIILGSGPRAIVLTAMGTEGGGVQIIGIEAPKDVRILREELVGRATNPYRRENQEPPPPPPVRDDDRDVGDETEPADEPDF